MNQENKDYLFLHFLVIIWGFTAILGLLIKIPSLEVVFYRTLLSSIGLTGVLLVLRKPFSLDRGSDYLQVIVVGFLFAIHWTLFFLSARVSNASVCLAGMATTSLWTSFIEPLYYKKSVRGYEVLLSLLALAGMLIIFNVE
jgi:drug/metabolite transporter (DMT)-like permease